MIKLGVNIDHVATLRQARKEGIPDLLEAAKAVKNGGGDGITIHLRQDRRHIQDQDVFDLKHLNILPINLEMAAIDEILVIALKLRPHSVCLVPEKREELTTEGGLDARGNLSKVKRVTAVLQENGIEVSLFIDPVNEQIEAAKEAEADAIELHTGRYANAGSEKKSAELEKIKNSIGIGLDYGLKVNAGHGLDYDNVTAVKELGGIREMNIGYSIICRAVFTGLEKAVKEMTDLII